MVYKCKICGGSLDVQPESRICVCEYCGTKQSVPNLTDRNRANLYDRANHFRRNNDFDKAMGIYERILESDKTDAEAYWSLILCKYGIEYVEDPQTHKRIPTCNRTQFTSIYADADYKAAVQNADAEQRELFEAEAEVIEGIQKEILSISQKEEPFDVFICYKETDSTGKRTPDSVLAQELYYELVEMGYRVFFSRITLEGKPGTAYEPYIFAALNSAKIMVVVGTKAEYLNAVWVKNEWSRYLALIKKGEKKVLIPAYRDMDPYDMPEEFSVLQAQDMSKLGFMQDLVRGIEKIISSNTKEIVPKSEKHTEQSISHVEVLPSISINALLERAFICLEDRDWQKADELLEQVLNNEPKNAKAYIGKVMAELKITKQAYLPRSATPLSSSTNFAKALRFADKNTQSLLKYYNQAIIKRNEDKRKDLSYQNACSYMNFWNTENLYTAIEKFKLIADYKDSEAKILECREKIKAIEEEEISNYNFIQRIWYSDDEEKKAILVFGIIILMFVMGAVVLLIIR